MYVADIEVSPENYPLVGVGFAFTVLAALTVVLRVYTRAVLIKNFGIDDALTVFAGLSSIGFLTAAIEQIRYGLGKPPDPKLTTPFQKSLFTSMTCYNLCHLFIKLSISLQCLRVFTTPTAKRVFRALIIYHAIYGPFCVLMSVFTCWPPTKFWDASVEGKCLERIQLRLGFAGVNIFNDLTLVCAPLPLLKNLHMATRAKYILMGVFAAGGVASAVACVRFYSLYAFGKVDLVKQPQMGMEIALWSGLESNLAIICACVPSLNPILSKLLPSFLISSGGGSGQYTPRSGPNASWRINKGWNSIEPEGRGGAEARSSRGIQVHQSFELGHMAVPDDDSEKYLVTSTATGNYHSEISIQASRATSK